MDQHKARLIIMRHSERLDSVLKNSTWPSECFLNGVYHPKSLEFPINLPNRSDPQSYLLDTPLTRFGHAHAHYIGQCFRTVGLIPTRVYASPAMRCVQTADSLIEGLEKRHRIKLKIDLSLHEPTRKLLPIETNEYFSSSGFHVDLQYCPLLSASDNQTIIGETRSQYYRRMFFILKRIIEETLRSFRTTLIVTHRSCVTLLAAMLNLDDIDNHLSYLYELESNQRADVKFLAMIIAEFDTNTGSWNFLTDFPSIPVQTD